MVNQTVTFSPFCVSINCFFFISKENLFKSLLQEFRKWRLDISISDEKKLTLEGKHEMVDLAERMQSRFPTILPEVYSNSSFKVIFCCFQMNKL